VPDPQRVLQMEGGQLEWPPAEDLAQLRQTPDWAVPLVEAALRSAS